MVVGQEYSHTQIPMSFGDPFSCTPSSNLGEVTSGSGSCRQQLETLQRTYKGEFPLLKRLWSLILQRSPC